MTTLGLCVVIHPQEVSQHHNPVVTVVLRVTGPVSIAQLCTIFEPFCAAPGGGPLVQLAVLCFQPFYCITHTLPGDSLTPNIWQGTLNMPWWAAVSIMMRL